MGDRAIAVCLSNCKLTAVTLPLYLLRLGCQGTARPQADGTTLMRQGGEGTARSQAGAGA